MELPGIVYLAFCLVSIFLTGWILATGAAILLHKPRKEESFNNVPFTLILCTKAGIHKLQSYVYAVLEQRKLPSEMCIVVDGSADGSVGWLAGLCKTYPFLRVLYRQERPSYLKGKKAALDLALRSAGHDRIVVTDDDCLPASRDWTAGLVDGLSGKTHVQLGISPLVGGPGLLGRFVELESTFTILQYIGLAILGHPYMGTGRNMAYLKSVVNTRGLEDHGHIRSGDDDLLLNPVLTSGNTAVSTAPPTFVFSPGKRHFSAYIRQKQRHYEASWKYRPADKVILATMNFSLGLAWLLGLLSMVFVGIVPVLPVLLFFLSLRWAIVAMLLNRFRLHRTIFWYPVLEILLPVAIAYTFFTSRTTQDQWN